MCVAILLVLKLSLTVTINHIDKYYVNLNWIMKKLYERPLLMSSYWCQCGI